MGSISQTNKYHLRLTLGTQIATYEELCTLLAEIEACLIPETCVPYLMTLPNQHNCTWRFANW